MRTNAGTIPRVAAALVMAATALVATVLTAAPASATPAGIGVTDTITVSSPDMSVAQSVVADSHGHLWIVAQRSQQIIRIDTATRAISQTDLSSCACNPWSITLSIPDETVWVGTSDMFSGKLIHISATGTVLDTHSPPTTHSGYGGNTVYHGGFKGLVGTSDGSIWFTGLSFDGADSSFRSEVGKYVPSTNTFTHYTSGVVDSPTTGLYHPQSIVSDDDGDLWVANYGDPPSRGQSVSKIDSTTGAITTYDGSAYLDGPIGMVLGGDGNVWVANEKYGSATGSLVKVSRSGTFTEYTDASLSGVVAITTARNSKLWILSSNAVTSFDLTNQAFAAHSIPGGTSAHSITQAADGALWYPELNTNEVRTTGIGLPQMPPTPVVYSPDSTHVTANVVTSSTHDGGSAITSWKLTASDGTTCTTTLPDPPCSITGLTPGVQHEFFLTYYNANGASYSSPWTGGFIPGGNGFNALPAPVRIFDSRTGIGTTTGVFGAGEHRSLVVAGQNGVPVSATAVVLNFGASGASMASGGFAAIAPTAGSFSAPTVSNLNFASDRAYSNAVTVAVGTGGSIDFYNRNGTTHLFADVIGFFDPTTGSTLIPMAPNRVFDTRSGTGTTQGRFAAGEHRDFDVVTAAALPPSTTAVVFNVTATNATAVSPAGWAAVTPTPLGNYTAPSTSNVNFTASSGAVATMVTCGIGSGGKVTFFNKNGDTHLIGDLVGYYTNDGSGARYFPLTPTRVVDTRTGNGVNAPDPIRTGQSLRLYMQGRGGVPYSSSVAAVLMNLTSARSTTFGWFGVYPGSTAHGNESSVNFLAGRAAANLVLATLNGSGAIDVYNKNGSADAIIDMAGYFAGTPTFSTS